ncbi:MAG: O-antigen ligase family protein, partial [Clostridiales bacterium]|nr:O-antigen ligase family protein [Clostridiales bacterium]
MPKEIALLICFLFILWLFTRDQKLRPMTSWELWIPFAWFSIIGTRFLSRWFTTEDVETYTDLLEGSPLDRYTFLSLIIAGAVVLWRRRPDWGRIFGLNRWFFIFFIYCAISIIWSDFPFASFKRWTKELGTIIMALIIITEDDPVQSTRALFARYAYIAIPLSVVLILFFPSVGRYPSETFEPTFTGVTTHKNTLGINMFLCSLFLTWELLHVRNAYKERRDLTDVLTRTVLLCTAICLIYLANSITALMCMILGTGILVFTKIPFFQRQVRYLGLYSLMFGTLIFFMSAFLSIISAIARIVGRDETLTGRTDLWLDLLREPINPLLGTGYQSFWLGPRVDYLWDKYLFHPLQAHNGYLETYLNGGLFGLLLLALMLIVT